MRKRGRPRLLLVVLAMLLAVVAGGSSLVLVVVVGFGVGYRRRSEADRSIDPITEGRRGDDERHLLLLLLLHVGIWVRIDRSIDRRQLSQCMGCAWVCRSCLPQLTRSPTLVQLAVT